jgi:hypothetical protein
MEPAVATEVIGWLRGKLNVPAGSSYESSQLELKGVRYFVNFCPQQDGELVTLHRQELAQVQVGGNIWLP